MPRVQLIQERDQASPGQLPVFEHIVASRGRVPAPFAAMLHRPEIARAAADLGAVIRFSSTLSDHDRELAILTTAVELDCAFERDAHTSLARGAGVSAGTVDAVLEKAPIDPRSDAVPVDFARELCRTGRVSDPIFDQARAALGETGVVELAAIVGYYSMLIVFMSACEAC